MIDDCLITMSDKRLTVTVAKKRADIPNGALTRGTIRFLSDLQTLILVFFGE